jgi:hypothetical protein
MATALLPAESLPEPDGCNEGEISESKSFGFQEFIAQQEVDKARRPRCRVRISRRNHSLDVWLQNFQCESNRAFVVDHFRLNLLSLSGIVRSFEFGLDASKNVLAAERRRTESICAESRS